MQDDQIILRYVFAIYDFVGFSQRFVCLFVMDGLILVY